MSKLTIEITDAGGGKKCSPGKRAKSRRKKRAAKPARKPRNTSTKKTVKRDQPRATKKAAKKSPKPPTKTPKATPRKTTKATPRKPVKKTSTKRAAPRAKKTMRQSVTPRPAATFRRRSGSMFRIKQSPYTDTPVHRLDDGPDVTRDAAAPLADSKSQRSSLRVGKDVAPDEKLKTAVVVRSDGEYRLAVGSPVFVRDETIYVAGRIVAATRQSAKRFTYEVRMGRKIMTSIIEDDIIPIANEGTAGAMGLADSKNASQHAPVVRALNMKFRALQPEINTIEGSKVFFVAYCGGKYGYMVRRYVAAACPKASSRNLEAYKPIGMGPKGLDSRFQKRYDMSWSKFMSSNVTTLRSAMKRAIKSDADGQAKASAGSIARNRKKVAKKTATKKRAATKAAKRSKPKSAAPVKKPARKTATPRRNSAPRPARSKKANGGNLDEAEAGMKRIEAMLAKAIA